jgi:glutamine synthetase
MSTPLDEFLAEQPLTESIDLLIPDLAGIPRGKRVPPDTLHSAQGGNAFFTTTIFALDTMGNNVDESGIVWEEGDADRLLQPDLSTLRPVPWRPGGAQVIAGLGNLDGTPFFADPRQLLAQIAARFQALSLTPMAALEFEFYLVDQANDAAGQPQPPTSTRLDGRPRDTEVFMHERLEDHEEFFELVDRWCAVQELPVKGAMCEFAPCQFEINLGHVDDMVLAVDHGFMFKRCVKAAARATGSRATFMAKPFEGLSGSGLHIHLSLVDREGRNVFGETETGETVMRQAIAGLQETMAESMLVFAPNANSYRRLRPLSYAPTAPTWGENNRTVALRIPPGPPKARRIEHRVAGSDANPYLVMAAILAGMLHGLEGRLEPTPPITGNAYAQTRDGNLPGTWEAAIDAFRGAAILPRYFGERFCRLFGTIRAAERNRFHGRVTPTEIAWYLTSV